MNVGGYRIPFGWKLFVPEIPPCRREPDANRTETGIDGEAHLYGMPEWYSFDCGDAHFVVLDSNDWAAPHFDKEMAWLRADLVANQELRVGNPGGFGRLLYSTTHPTVLVPGILAGGQISVNSGGRSLRNMGWTWSSTGMFTPTNAMQ